MSTKKEVKPDDTYWAKYEQGGISSESGDASFSILKAILKEFKQILKDRLQKTTKRDRV